MLRSRARPISKNPLRLDPLLDGKSTSNPTSGPSTLPRAVILMTPLFSETEAIGRSMSTNPWSSEMRTSGDAYVG